MTQTSLKVQQFQETQTFPGNQHFQETPDSQHTEQFQEQQLSLVNQRSQHREHSLTLSQRTISTSQFTGGPFEGVTNQREKEGKFYFHSSCSFFVIDSSFNMKFSIRALFLDYVSGLHFCEQVEHFS